MKLPGTLRAVTGTSRDLTEQLGEPLCDRNTGEGRFTLYNVGPLTDVGKFDVIPIVKTPEEAQKGIDKVLPKRFGLYALPPM